MGQGSAFGEICSLASAGVNALLSFNFKAMQCSLYPRNRLHTVIICVLWGYLLSLIATFAFKLANK